MCIIRRTTCMYVYVSVDLGQRYYKIEETMFWNAARDRCVADGGKLAEPHNAEENNEISTVCEGDKGNNYCIEHNLFVVPNISYVCIVHTHSYTVNCLICLCYLAYCWIGITDLETEGTYRYTSDGSVIEYTDWNTNQPDNYGNNEDCIHIV